MSKYDMKRNGGPGRKNEKRSTKKEINDVEFYLLRVSKAYETLE